jgi:hypothetical protein
MQRTTPTLQQAKFILDPVLHLKLGDAASSR